MGQNFTGKLNTFEATSRKCPLKMTLYTNNVANIHGNIQEEEPYMIKAASLQ